MGIFSKHLILFFTRARARTRSRTIKIELVLIAFLFSAPHFAWALDSVLQNAANQISNSNDDTALTAIQALGRSRNPDAAAPLIQAFSQEQRADERRYIVNALNLIRNPESKSTLLAALKDSDPGVRASAVVALEGLGDSDCVTALINQVAIEKDSTVKAYLARFYGRSKHPKATDALKMLSQDADDNVRLTAIDSLNKKANNNAPSGQ